MANLTPAPAWTSPMAAHSRNVVFHTYQPPRLTGQCLGPKREIMATPSEVIAEILAALEPLPDHLDVEQITNTAIHIYDPNLRHRTVKAGEDHPTGAIIKFGLSMADVIEAICDLYRDGMIPAPDAGEEGGRVGEDGPVD
jgi:hypothetical protein